MTVPHATEVCAGPVTDLPEGTCVAVGDGAAMVVRTGDEVRAFVNRCLHQDSPLTGGWVRDGVLTCPQHFWRYDVGDGRCIGTDERLDRLTVRVVDGDAFVEVPARPARTLSLREQLLDRARTYDRAASYHQSQRGRPC